MERFSYEYDATGKFIWPDFAPPDVVDRILDELGQLGWSASRELPLVERIDDIIRERGAIADLAEQVFASEWLRVAMTYPHRLVESYAIRRLQGGRLPLHGGSSERLDRMGRPEAEDISSAYWYRSGRMYSFRVKTLLYLDPVVNPDDGLLYYVEGSHKANLSFLRTYREGSPEPSLVKGAERLFREVPVRPGTLVVLNEALVHGAGLKRSARERRFIVFSFAPSFATDWSELDAADADLKRTGYAVPDSEDSNWR